MNPPSRDTSPSSIRYALVSSLLLIYVVSTRIFSNLVCIIGPIKVDVGPDNDEAIQHTCKELVNKMGLSRRSSMFSCWVFQCFLNITSEKCLFLQLINDKKALSERCEGVVGELKQVDQKYTKKITQMQEQHEMVREVPSTCADLSCLCFASCVTMSCFLAVLLLFNFLFSLYFPSFFFTVFLSCLYTCFVSCF